MFRGSSQDLFNYIVFLSAAIASRDIKTELAFLLRKNHVATIEANSVAKLKINNSAFYICCQK